jgi:ankyrin repeat protein
MDHKIDELGECIFDYLSSCPDCPKSLTEIYNSISGTTGHRCTELNSYPKKDIYKKKFMTECYSLDSKFDNVHKIFKKDKLYLVYSNKEKADVLTMFNSYETHIPNLYGEMDLDAILEYVIDNYEDHNDFDFNSPMVMHHLIKNNKVEQFKKVVELFDVDINSKDSSGKTLMDIALENNNAALVKALMEQDSNNKVSDLMISNKNLKQFNTKFNKQCEDLLEKNNSLTQQLRNNQKNKWGLYCLVALLIVSNTVSMIFSRC